MRGSATIVLSLALAALLLPCCPCAMALDPSLDASQYAHTSWKVRDGFSKSEIIAIAQTPDGYLWLGTGFGLLRFDGVKNVPWQPPANQHLPSDLIFTLLATRDGTLWIGTEKGLASWKDGKLTQYPALADHFIFAIIQDHEGTVWASGASITLGKLCAIRNSNIQCEPEGTLGRGAVNLYEDSHGNLWAGVKDGLWRWRPGPPKFYPLKGEPDGIQAISEDDHGTLVVCWKGSLYRFADGKIEPFLLSGSAQPFRAHRMIRDRDGGLWIGTTNRGLLHVHQGRIDRFSQPDGLSGDSVQSQFQDREGNIWVATVGGLDRFREFAVATMTRKQGLLNDSVGAVVADRDGSVWLATRDGLDRWNNGEVSTYRTGLDKARDNTNAFPNSLFQDSHGRVWVSTLRHLGYLENDRFVPLSGVPGGNVLAIVEERSGDLWEDNENAGLIRLSPRGEVHKISWGELGHKDYASVLAADPSQGGLWIGFFWGGIAYFKDGRIRASYTTADGLGAGRVSDFRFDSDGTLWISTAGGLSRLKSGHLTSLTSNNGLPCQAVHWMMEDDQHSVWLYTPCGLLRMARAELDAWAAAVDKDRDAKPSLAMTVFDSFDGVRSLAGPGHRSPQVAKSSDGRLWFLPWDGVSVIDPRHLPLNKLPAPVHIEQITADRKTYDAALSGNRQLRLPPLIHELQIDYTALSLVAPEKVRFRYKLEGWDHDWQDADNRRQAIYGNLSPGSYRFRVMACNNSGVWNEAGTFLNFSVAPAYYQTPWFRLACAFAFLALLAGLYRLRVRQLAGQLNLRLEERVNERTRIARDLHDTLLQSFQGLMLKFRVLTFLLPDRPAEARKMLEEVIEQARAAITEGRDAVQGLRASTLATNDLAQAISTLGEQLRQTRGAVAVASKEEINAGQTGQQSPDFRVHVEGEPREIVPQLRDDVYRIAGEALRNAFQHARPRQVEVETRYDQRQFRLRVRDDGKGIDPRVLVGDREPGHYGLPGMHERARLIGGKLEVWSELDSGTEVELTIPASLAYAEWPVMRRFMFQKNSN